MPFKGNRIWIIIIAGTLLAALIFALSATAPGSKPVDKLPAGLITCTVNGNVGVHEVLITNQNTGKSIIKTAADLPFTFNLSQGDSLRLMVVLEDGYLWNAWEINQMPYFADDNPFIIPKIEKTLVLSAQCLLK